MGSDKCKNDGINLKYEKVEMKLLKYSKLVLLMFATNTFTGLIAQESTTQSLTLNQAIELALQNHQQLKVSLANLELNKQQLTVAKMQQLPTVSLSANAFYLSDAKLLDPDFNKVTSVEMPHFGNNYALQATQLLFKGGVIRNSVKVADLKVQLAELDLQKDQQSIKYLVISNYLDLYKLQNQLIVYKKNRVLADERLVNLKKMFEQEMITKTELLRAELQIKNLEQGILTLANGLDIINTQLDYALGLPVGTVIIPTESLEERALTTPEQFIATARKENLALKTLTKNVEVADKAVSISKSDYYPAIAAFAGYNMQRPITTKTPALDMYTNTWQAGVSLNYNIDNLLKSRQKVKASLRQKEMLNETLELTKQNIEIAVLAAHSKYQEAVKQQYIANEAKVLAIENYKLVESKYLNQLAITAEMTDASNARLEAELQYENARINAAFQYYTLLKNTGTL